MNRPTEIWWCRLDEKALKLELKDLVMPTEKCFFYKLLNVKKETCWKYDMPCDAVKGTITWESKEVGL